MQKGIIKSLNRKSGTNPEGKSIPFVEVMLEDDARLISVWGTELKDKMIGDELELEITEKDGKFKGKLAGASKPLGSPMRGKSPEELKQMARTMSMSYSKDLCVALIAKEVLSMQNLDKELIRLANILHAWVTKEGA